MSFELATPRGERIPSGGGAPLAVGIDGLFTEVHEAPERALSDGPNALRLDLLGPLLARLRRLDALAKEAGFLS